MKPPPWPQQWRGWQTLHADGQAPPQRLRRCQLLRPGHKEPAIAACRAVPEMDALQTLCGTVKIQVGRQSLVRGGGRGTGP